MLPALALPVVGLMQAAVYPALLLSWSCFGFTIASVFHSGARHLLAASILYLPALFGLFCYSVCALL